jgi:hypothetical protein
MSELIPFRWPAQWQDPALLDFLKGTPINCLAGTAPPPFPAGDLPFIKLDANHPPDGVLLRDGVWPQVLVAKEKDAALAGATGGPWVDSNCHVVRLAQIKEPGKQVWLTYSPPGGKDILPMEDYIRPVAEAGTYGARWVITLDEPFAQGLEKRSEKALGIWQQMMSVLKYYESHAEWRAWEPVAALAVISNFAGETELMAVEFLNLAPRRHLAHRIILTSEMGKAALDRQKAVIYLESAPPEGEDRKKLLRFAENGGTLFSPAGIVNTKPVETRQAHAIHTLGRGRVIVPLDKWEDPFGLARQVHLLLSMREDVVSVWNGGDMNSYYLSDREGKRGVVHLIPYASGKLPFITIGLQRPYRTARVITAGATTQVKPVTRVLGTEIPVGEFSCFAAVELEL